MCVCVCVCEECEYMCVRVREKLRACVGVYTLYMYDIIIRTCISYSINTQTCT